MHASTARNPGSLVSARITPLRLEAFEQLPKHARRCVFWEVDPATLRGEGQLCGSRIREGSMAVDGHARVGIVRTGGGPVRHPAMTACHAAAGRDDPCLGYAFYAPPRAVPRARHFPTGPVSADAVLLTSLGVEPCDAADADAAQPDRRGRRRPGPPRRARARGVRPHRRGCRTGRPASGAARTAAGRRSGGGLLGATSACSTRICSRTPASSSWRTTGTSRGCGSSSSRDWAGRPTSKRRWSACWRRAQLQQPVGAGAGPC